MRSIPGPVISGFLGKLVFRGRTNGTPTKLELPQTDIDMLIDIAPELLLEDLDARIVD